MNIVVEYKELRLFVLWLVRKKLHPVWEFCVWFRDIVVCVFVFLPNDLEDIFDNARLELKFVVFSGNHDNHAWSDLSVISINWMWLR